MNVRVAVIGNSHLAAFKLGWDKISHDFPKLDLVFFGSPATSMRFLRVECGNIVPTSDLVRENFIWTSGGSDKISGSFDCYIVVGMGFSFIHLLALLKEHRTPDIYDPERFDHQLISRDFFDGAMRATLANSNAIVFLQMLNKISNAPKIYVPNPYGTKEVLADDRYEFYRMKDICDYVFSFYSEQKNFLLKDICILEDQPTETVEDVFFTKTEYSRGSIKLKKGMSSVHNNDDFFHMNENFGIVSLRHILESVLFNDLIKRAL